MPSSKKDQLNLFRVAPTKIKYLEELPLCGVCRKEKAAFHAPTKANIWADMCKPCSEPHTNNRFHLGYKLIKHVSNNMGGPLLETTEKFDVTLVATGIKPRTVVCVVCAAQRKVDLSFAGAIICHGCRSRLRVTKLI